MLPLLEKPSTDDWEKDLAFTISRNGGESIRTHDWRFTHWDFGSGGMELYDLKMILANSLTLRVIPSTARPSKSLSCNLKLSESRLVLPISGLAERKSEGRF